MIAGCIYGRMRIGMKEILARAKVSSAVGGSPHGSASARPNAVHDWSAGCGRAVSLLWRDGCGRSGEKDVHHAAWIDGHRHVERALWVAESHGSGHSQPVDPTVDGLTHRSAYLDGFAAARSAGDALIERRKEGGCQFRSRAIHSHFPDCVFR